MATNETQQQKGETMTRTNTGTSAEAIATQHLCIAQAIELLQNDLDKMTNEINPDTAKWVDVSRFAHVSAMAQRIITEYAEQSDN